MSLALAAPAFAGETQERLRSLLETGLDAEQCYRVRDLFLEREDVKLYFTDGLLIFAKPHRGRDVAALFVSERPEDGGEVVVIPPDGRERQSALQFTGQTVINERFRSALMLFSDDTAEVLRADIEEQFSHKRDADAGSRVASRWSPVLRNILEGVSLRVLVDLVSDVPTEDGFFAAAIGGGRLGRFDVVIDPRQTEQLAVGQSVTRSGQSYYETWVQFAARSYRQGRRRQVRSQGRMDDYEIEATIGDDLSLDVTTRATFTPSTNRYRAFALALSRSLRVAGLKVNGQEVEVLQLGRPNRGGQGRDDDSVLFVMPEYPKAREPLRLELSYRGELISRAGDGVFFVRNRANWYPTSDRTFSDFKLTFHYPAQLGLVATGKRTEHEVTEGFSTSVFETETPARLAGFNLGRFVTAERQVDDYVVEVHANRNVEERLKPKTPAAMYVPAPPSPRRRRFSQPPVLVTRAAPPAPNPAARIDAVADLSREAFSFFLKRYGPPPTSTVVISPIPASFGQGFPGLVYASTLSYLSPNDPPVSSMAPSDQVFYSKLLLPHEISHQWWGNLVAVDSTSDNWILESLATYSSLLFLEEQEGAEARDRMLAAFRGRLLAENDDGATVESAGPLVLGDRLRSGKFPSAYRVILYEKGAWVIHMLRSMLGDERFLSLLRALPERRRAQYLTLEEFREMAAAQLPDGHPDPELRDFFDHWVHNTGVPEFSIRWKQDKGRITGALTRSGVSEQAAITTPLRLVLDSGETIEWMVVSDGAVTELNRAVPGKVSRVEVNPDRTLLTAGEPST